jgi:hypothetical protein
MGEPRIPHIYTAKLNPSKRTPPIPHQQM